ARGIGEEQLPERPRLRPMLAVDQAFEDQHVLVLMIEDDPLERPVERIVRTIERGRMPLRADRAGRHQPATVDATDPRVLDSVALMGPPRRDNLVVMQSDDLEPIGAELDS